MSTEWIQQLLSDKNLKVTPQRLIIAEYLTQSKAHPTADEVYESVKDRLPTCSKATVYNTLNTLVDHQIIYAISTEPGQVRYEANLIPHHHFVNVDTGQIVDLPWEAIEPVQARFGDEFKVTGYQVTFFGKHLPDKLDNPGIK